jgi:hypothetical protein
MPVAVTYGRRWALVAMAGICLFDILTTAGVKAKAEILPFGITEIVVGIVVEIFGHPELLSISIDDAIDSLILALCDVFGLRGHRARPFVERGRVLNKPKHGVCQAYQSP